MAITLLSACGGSTASLTTGIDLANLDTTAAPGTDFYRFATGGWSDSHPLTAEYARYGSFDQLAENNQKQLRELIEEVAAAQNEPGSIADKIAQMYNSAMDSVSLNAQGIEPIRKDLQRIEECFDKAELSRLYAGLQAEGVGGLYGFYIDADIKNSIMNLVQVVQSGLMMGQKEYYLDTDSATTAIREAYKDYMSNLFRYCKVATDGDVNDRVASVLAFETELAKASRNRTELRDDELNYNKMSFDSLLVAFPGIDWNFYFSIHGAKGVKEVSVGQPEFIHAVETLWSQADLAVLKDYIRWQLINAASNYLDDEMRAESFKFFGTVMSGRQEDRPR
ncbi:MAG: M13 family metallopeptidase, partial [Bacteroidaceae bacterium]|nr:M13 family metallopeptidase [Bacteroidaceae bacterium]